MIRIHKLLAATVAALGGSIAFAQTPALSWSTSGLNPTAITSTRGYAFDVLAPEGILVTDLTFFDADADGLAEAHDIGLWNSSGTLLASTSIAAGTSAPLDVNSLFRVVPITPVFLAQGTNYAVGATFNASSPDFQAYNLTALTTPPQIQYDQMRYSNNGLPTLTMPTNTLGFTGLPGGSFQFQAVPEPTTMVGLGLGAVALIRRRRQ